MDVDVQEIGVNLFRKLTINRLVSFRDNTPDMEEHIVSPTIVQEFWEQDLLELNMSEVNKVHNMIAQAAKYNASYIRFVTH